MLVGVVIAAFSIADMFPVVIASCCALIVMCCYDVLCCECVFCYVVMIGVVSLVGLRFLM